MRNLSFSTKAGTLSTLEGVVNSAQIPASIFFTGKSWRQNPTNCLESIYDSLGDGPFIVRSSSKSEDTHQYSQAGRFLSVLDVTVENLAHNIELVFKSYDGYNEQDEVLVQPMLKDVTLVGVAFSHDPNTSSPYRIINYSEDNDTTSITGGLYGGFTWQQAAASPKTPPKKLTPVIDLINELLKIFDYKPLDIEFCFTSEKSKSIPWLLQVRPLILRAAAETVEEQSDRLKALEKSLDQRIKRHPSISGRKTVYGVMPDWNPAEIIGIRPKALALSLYKELVTDSIWAYQRHNYGYRNLRSFPLMIDFSGLPYIDVRLSFNSFIPAKLDPILSDKLVDYYIDRLLDSPNLHDKVEFDIVFSCYTFDLEQRIKAIASHNFSNNQISEIISSLTAITKNVFTSKKGIWHKDVEKVGMLESRRRELYESNLGPIETIYWLIEDAKRYGSLPFAGLARAAFMAVQLLKSLVAVGVFSEHDYDNFMLSVKTIAGQLSQEKNELSKKRFIEKYGHLRPGTYEITSPRYDENPDLYFDWNASPKLPVHRNSFPLSQKQTNSIDKLLKDNNFDLDSKKLMDFLRDAIERREWAKFHFTHNLSDALSIIKNYGANIGFAVEDLSHCNFNIIREIYSSSINHKKKIYSSIAEGKLIYEAALKTSLPPLIEAPKDVWGFNLPEGMPNFITQKIVSAPVTLIEKSKQFEGKIVCIPNGDPGFDWLFSFPLAGLITAWGGINSHMAIRAGELGLPAVIGSGEKNYNNWQSAKVLKIDCPNKRVEIIS